MELIWDKAAHVSIRPEAIFQVFGFSVTNSLIMTLIVSAIIIGLGLLVKAQLKPVPSRLQAMFETLVESLYNLVKSTAPAHVDEFYPLIMTFFIFILTSNWIGLLPAFGGVGLAEPIHEAAEEQVSSEAEARQITDFAVAQADEVPTLYAAGTEAEGTQAVTVVSTAEVVSDTTIEHGSAETETTEESGSKLKVVPFLRATTADLNTTIALALIAVIATWYYGIKYLGVKGQLGKFFNLKGIGSFVGILELIGEFSRVLSFSFRLFGNIFAGEVLLAVIGSLLPFFVPIPFLALEVFVGAIQALVFSMLALVFLSIAVEHSH